MQIVRAELKACTLRKADPAWRFALAASPITEGVIVTIEADDGAAGFGYGSATAHMGAPQSRLFAALGEFAGRLYGRDATDIEGIVRLLDRGRPGHNQAKAAIECALYDLNARAGAVPLHRLLGGKLRDCVPILRILAIKTPDEMAAEAQKLVDRGYRYLKIKVEGDVDEDLARVRAVRAQVGEGVRLTVDANQSYTVEAAIAAITRMAEFGVDLAEQPVAANDLAGLKKVTDSVPVPVEADESANSLARVKELVDGRIVDSVSLKIPKLGGIRNTLAAARICDEAGIACRMGAAVGSRLLSAQAMHVACVLPKLDYACELGEFARLLGDPFEGIEIVKGELRLPEEAGSGVSLRPSNGRGPAPRRKRSAPAAGT